MKRRVLYATVATGFVLVVAPESLGQGDPPGSIAVAPVRLELPSQATRGGNYEMFFTVVNRGSTSTRLSIVARELSTKTGAQLRRRVTAARWVGYSPAVFTLRPRQARKVRVLVRVPGKRKAARRRLGVVFRSTPPAKPGQVRVAVRLIASIWVPRPRG